VPNLKGTHIQAPQRLESRSLQSHQVLLLLALSLAGVLSFLSLNPPSGYPDLYEASILELQTGLDKNYFTSVDLVKASFRVASVLTWLD
jgi:hypothetical protein